MKQIGMSIVNLVQQQPWAITEEMLDIINQVLYDRYFGIDTEKGQYENKFEPLIITVPVGGG